MTNNEITALIEECKALYSVYRSMYEDEKIIREWYRILKHYDLKDVYASLERHKEGNYQRNPIVLGDLIRNVKTIEEKQNQDLDNLQIWCKNCGRVVPYNEAQKHEDRCRSTDYIIAQYKKWYHKDLTRQFLWTLSEEDFNQRYDTLLHYIHDHTTNPQEKKVIEYIFNPPNEEEVKEFFGGQNE